VNRATQLEAKLQRWTEAGLIDSQSSARILAFERGQERRASLRWPIILAMVFGGILFAAGITLFVAAHWSELSPAMRFFLLLLMVGILHVGGAALAERFPALSTTLHALGTATLGAAIFLTAQIFNLHENWATGILLWAVGAAIGYILLRDWPQAAFLALLAPAWLVSEWAIKTDWHRGSNRPVALGLILAAICYLSARIGDQENTVRRTLVWVGAIALLPCIGVAIGLGIEEGYSHPPDGRTSLTFAMLLLGWTVAVGMPVLLSWLLRGRAAWINVLWALWAYVLILSAGYVRSYESNLYQRHLVATLTLYALCATGSVGLVLGACTRNAKNA
jgi:MFS family permease